MWVSGNGEGGGRWEKVAVNQASYTRVGFVPPVALRCAGDPLGILLSPAGLWFGAGPGMGAQRELGWELLKHPGDSGKSSSNDETQGCKLIPLKGTFRGCMLFIARFFSLLISYTETMEFDLSLENIFFFFYFFFFLSFGLD